jgi:murein DD-endopeptidase MepM/ murein hydrolase activator NlpD
MMVESLADLASWWIVVLAAQSVNVSVIFVAVLLLTRVMRRLEPSLHLVLWSLVFVRLLLPPGLTHPWSVGALMDRAFPKDVAVGSRDVGGMEAVAAGMPAGIGVPTGDLQMRHGSAGLAVFWLVGAAIALVVYRRRLRPFHDQARAARPVVDPMVQELIGRWRRRLNVRRRVRIVTSTARATPFTLGVTRPIIFVPHSVIDDRRLLESVIAHEMAHVARWDALWLGLQHLLQAVYFFHPLVWLAGARLGFERERLCDATVVSAGRIPARFYVGGLLNVLQLDLQGVGAPTMAARKRRIGVRITNILERDGARRPRLAAAVAVAVSIGVFLLPLAGGGADTESAMNIGSSKTEAPAALEADSIELVNPLPGGRVTWRWGHGLDPWTKEKIFHRGIDVAAKTGTEVVAPADGKIIVATEAFDESPASGTVIVIDHGDGWKTFYAHLGSLEVTNGQNVSRQDVIAKVGSTGKSTGPHLHFEVRHDGEQLNPAEFVSDWK